MKRFQIDDIINRRKSIKETPRAICCEQKEGGKCLQKPIREINDQTIDSLIEIAIKHEALNQENKLNILQIIASKTGVNLNKNIIVPFIELIYYP